jgi:DNA-directed RNA polymerase specialized sigma24 family protein
MRLDSDKTVASKKYEDIRRTLVKFFDWNRCLRADELADETLNRVAGKLKTEEIQNVNAYALGIARFVLLEDFKKYRREYSVEDISGGLDSIASPEDTEREIVERIDGQIMKVCLHECRAKLGAEDSVFVIAYYSAEDEKQKIHRQRLANTQGMTIGALRTRARRLREKLEQCVIGCLENRRRAYAIAYSRRQAESR